MASCRRSSQPRLGRATALTAAAAASAALVAVPAGAEPHDPSDGSRAANAPRGALDRFYEEAERATEKYNAADVRAEGLRARVERVQDRVARGQERVNRMRTALGAVAGAQYRSGSLDPGIELLLSERPAHYLDKAATLERIAHRQAGQLKALQGAQRSLRQQRTEATVALTELETSRRAVARHKATVERKLASARRLLNALPPGERDAYGRASRGERGPYDLPGLGGLPAASARSAAAILAARQAVGLPYVWGAAGPGAFDCSGLTQWAYGRAGVAIPRTSQEQRHAGSSVPLSQARPGDLVVYRSDASHIAMYAGGGQVIHAPYPGARVRYDPVGMMPISSITRV